MCCFPKTPFKYLKLFLPFWCSAVLSVEAQNAVPGNMVLIPAGTFLMGGDPGLMGGGSQSHSSSYPIHEVVVDAFWMDATEVTNRQFAEFVEATGYVTFAASTAR